MNLIAPLFAVSNRINTAPALFGNGVLYANGDFIVLAVGPYSTDFLGSFNRGFHASIVQERRSAILKNTRILLIGR